MSKIVESRVYTLQQLFLDKFDVDFYQRQYVWQKKQMADLINDLSNEFLKNWKPNDNFEAIKSYSPYFMGEIVISEREGKRNAIIDGQQRITSFTLLLIYILQTYGASNMDSPLRSDIEKAIYSNDYGNLSFNINIEQRKAYMKALFDEGFYTPTEKDKEYVQNIVDRYNDISECWNENINAENISHFSYWILGKVMFSKVWTNNDEFAYVIFETMNDRGLSLTRTELLRSYLLAKIAPSKRTDAIKTFGDIVKRLASFSKKADEDFFKVYLRGHYAETLSQKDSHSDFVRIGNEFHRWVRDNESLLNLKTPDDCETFLSKIDYFSKQYEKIYKYINNRDAGEYFYLIVNNDYDFTLQPALILSAIAYKDPDDTVETKIQIVSKYLTKVLSWHVWNHEMIAQSSFESKIYGLCKEIRNMDIKALKAKLDSDPIELPALINSPTLNQQNKRKIKVLLALITEIVARESNASNYILNTPDIEVEHIWSNHLDQHLDEFDNEDSFATMRNNIGDLLVLPKSFNASYGDDPYTSKVEQYFGQNILAQTLNEKQYKNHPDFERFMSKSKLLFKSYKEFKKSAIVERANLYKSILLWNWS